MGQWSFVDNVSAYEFDAFVGAKDGTARGHLDSEITSEGYGTWGSSDIDDDGINFRYASGFGCSTANGRKNFADRAGDALTANFTNYPVKNENGTPSGAYVPHIHFFDHDYRPPTVNGEYGYSTAAYEAYVPFYRAPASSSISLAVGGYKPATVRTDIHINGVRRRHIFTIVGDWGDGYVQGFAFRLSTPESFVNSDGASTRGWELNLPRNLTAHPSQPWVAFDRHPGDRDQYVICAGSTIYVFEGESPDPVKTITSPVDLNGAKGSFDSNGLLHLVYVPAEKTQSYRFNIDTGAVEKFKRASVEEPSAVQPGLGGKMYVPGLVGSGKRHIFVKEQWDVWLDPMFGTTYTTSSAKVASRPPSDTFYITVGQQASGAAEEIWLYEGSIGPTLHLGPWEERGPLLYDEEVIKGTATDSVSGTPVKIGDRWFVAWMRSGSLGFRDVENLNTYKIAYPFVTNYFTSNNTTNALGSPGPNKLVWVRDYGQEIILDLDSSGAPVMKSRRRVTPVNEPAGFFYNNLNTKVLQKSRMVLGAQLGSSTVEARRVNSFEYSTYSYNSSSLGPYRPGSKFTITPVVLDDDRVAMLSSIATDVYSFSTDSWDVLPPLQLVPSTLAYYSVVLTPGWTDRVYVINGETSYLGKTTRRMEVNTYDLNTGELVGTAPAPNHYTWRAQAWTIGTTVYLVGPESNVQSTYWLERLLHPDLEISPPHEYVRIRVNAEASGLRSGDMIKGGPGHAEINFKSFGGGYIGALIAGQGQPAPIKLAAEGDGYVMRWSPGGKPAISVEGKATAPNVKVGRGDAAITFSARRPAARISPVGRAEGSIEVGVEVGDGVTTLVRGGGSALIRVDSVGDYRQNIMGFAKILFSAAGDGLVARQPGRTRAPIRLRVLLGRIYSTTSASAFPAHITFQVVGSQFPFAYKVEAPIRFTAAAEGKVDAKGSASAAIRVRARGRGRTSVEPAGDAVILLEGWGTAEVLWWVTAPIALEGYARGYALPPWPREVLLELPDVGASTTLNLDVVSTRAATSRLEEVV